MRLSFKALEDAMKKDKVVCLMVDDPNSLGAAMVCHFMLQKTKSNTKGMRQYSAQSAIEMVKRRRI